MGQDRQLIERAQAGDHAAFAELARAQSPLVWAVCYRICGNHADAEDAVQDTLVAVWRNLGRFRHDAGFSTWVYRIATNASLMLIRRRRDLAVDPTTVEPVAATTGDPGDRATARATVGWALAQLPIEFSEILVLREFADLSYKEIATTTGAPINTVKSRINRARRAVAALLADEG